MRVVDHAGGRYEHLHISGSRTAAVHVSLNARLELDAFDHNTFAGNGVDGVVRGDGAWGASLDTPDAEAGDGADSGDEVLFGDAAFETLDTWLEMGDTRGRASSTAHHHIARE